MASSNIPKKLIPDGAIVRPFEMRVLGQEQRPTYQSIKKGFKEDKANTRDARFLLSEMVHSHLSVEAEEERRFTDRLAQEMGKRQNEIQEAAYKEGFEKGMGEGRQLAFEQEKARLATLIEGLAHVVSVIGEAKSTLAADYETRLVSLAYRMASVIVDHQIKHQPEIVSYSIRAILEKIGQDEDIHIRLSTEDHGIVDQLQEELKTFSHKGRVSLDLDANIRRGDCIVEAASGEIASFINDKLEAVRAELEKIYPNIDLPSRKTGT
ncbi:MAG: FliH/SctL family protein [Bdellovibrionota bacterium]